MAPTYHDRVLHTVKGLGSHGRPIIHLNTIRAEVKKDATATGKSLGKRAAPNIFKAVKSLVDEGVLTHQGSPQRYRYLPAPATKRRRSDVDGTPSASPAKRRKSAGGASAAPPAAHTRRASAAAPIRKPVSVSPVGTVGTGRASEIEDDEDGEDEEMSKDDGEELRMLRAEVARLRKKDKKNEDEIALFKAAAAAREQNDDDVVDHDDQHELGQQQDAPSPPAAPAGILPPIDAEELVSMRDKLDDANVENVRLTQLLDEQKLQAEAEVVAAQARVHTLEANAAEAKKKADTTITALKDQLSNALRRIGALEAQKAEVNAETDATVMGLQAEVNTARNRVRELEARAAEVTKQADAVTTGFQGQLANAQRHIDALEAQVAEAKADDDAAVQGQLAEAQRYIGALEAQITLAKAGANRAVAGLEAKLTSAHERVSELQLARSVEAQNLRNQVNGLQFRLLSTMHYNVYLRDRASASQRAFNELLTEQAAWVLASRAREERIERARVEIENVQVERNESSHLVELAAELAALREDYAQQ